MEIRRIRALRGPNIWARFPVLEALVDLQELKDTGTDSIPGFNDRVMGWLPTMIEHRCGPGVRGGFFKRLRNGTWMGHVMEHVTLELQALSYKDAGYGKARETSEEGVYRVAFHFRDEEQGKACMETALNLCMAAAYNLPFDVEAEIAKLKQVAKQVCLPESVYLLTEAARERHIPVMRLNQQGVIQLGYGRQQRRLFGTITDHHSALTEQIVADRELKEELLRSVQVFDRDQLQGDLHHLLVVGKQVVAAVRWSNGEAIDVSAQVAADIAKKAVDSAKILGLDIAGVDVQIADISQPFAGQHGGIIDVHPQPKLEEYLPVPALLEQSAKAILDYLFPGDKPGQIPLACVTGVNGKTTTTRLLAQMVAGTGLKTGMTCTDGVFIAGERIEAADCSGPRSARMILRHPDIEAAVLEVARGGILREGLGFDRADVSIVTNVGEGDHLGIGYVNTAEELAFVKSTVIDAVREVTGVGVLNAADPLCVGMKKYCRGTLTYFALDGQHPVIVEHRAAGGTAFFVRDNNVIAAEGEKETVVISLAEVPLTRGGKIGFQIENVLAATAGAWGLQIPPEAIQRELRVFDSNMAQTPGRFNVIERHGAAIILDYGHNPSAIVSLIESLEKFPQQKRTVVYGADGDRRDDQIIRQAQLLGDAFDTAILYEEPSRRRGREPNACYDLLEQGLQQGKRVKNTQRIDGEMQAIAAALKEVQSGDLLLIQVDAVDADLAFIESLLAR